MVESVDDLVDVCPEVWREVVRVLMEPGSGRLGEFPDVSYNVWVVEVVTGSRRAFLTASEIEYPRVRSPWMKRRTFVTA